MRKNVLYVLGVILMMGMTSCESDQPELSVAEEKRMQVVSFEVEGFEEQTSGLRSGGQSFLPADSDIEYLEYIAINTDESKKTYIKRKGITKDEIFSDKLPSNSERSAGNMGLVAIKDTLPYGNYDVIILASTGIPPYTPIFLSKQSEVHSFDMISTMDIDGDVFMKESFNITVGSEPVNMKQTLKRIKGKVEVILNDINSIPADVKSVKFGYTDLYPWGIWLGTGFPVSVTYYNPDPSAVGSPFHALSGNNFSRADILNSSVDKPLSFLMMPYGDSQFDFVLKARIERNDGSVEFKLIKNGLKVYRNKITRLTGSLFTNNGVGVDPSVETEWDETIEESFD